MFDTRGINLSYMQNKGNEKDMIQTHTMSRFNANKINLNSNKNTNIKGNTIKADKIHIDAYQNNLNTAFFNNVAYFVQKYGSLIPYNWTAEIGGKL